MKFFAVLIDYGTSIRTQEICKKKKLRDKTPYGEENGVIFYVAYHTFLCSSATLRERGFFCSKRTL